jgi:dTDP-4-dehydrorhamnose reductase
MKILVTGANGQLGYELRNVLEERHPGVTAYVDIDELDLTDRQAVEVYLKQNNFSHIINCAAYTAVERAEEEKLKCASINIDGIANLGRFADELGLHIVHISTDYVFDGESCRPYTESDKVNPVSQYGATKRKGETALLGLAPDSVVIRTSWLYSPNGHNFVKTMLRLAKEYGKVNVVCDQIGTPTYARDLAETIVDIVFAPQWVSGIFNYSNEGVCSWYDFAVAIFEAAQMECHVEAILTDQTNAPVKRPYYSVLDKTKIKATYCKSVPHWQASLKKCIARINAGDGSEQ